jgi:hypothetical protein
VDLRQRLRARWVRYAVQLFNRPLGQRTHGHSVQRKAVDEHRQAALPSSPHVLGLHR